MDVLFRNGVGFPAAIMHNIMKRLHFDVLERFMEVSINWNNSISSNYFKRTHYRHNAQIQGVDVFQSTLHGGYLDFDFNMKVLRDRTPHQACRQFTIHPSIPVTRWPIIIGMNDGIVCCLYDAHQGVAKGYMFAVCNPHKTNIVRAEQPPFGKHVGMF